VKGRPEQLAQDIGQCRTERASNCIEFSHGQIAFATFEPMDRVRLQARFAGELPTSKVCSFAPCCDTSSSQMSMLSASVFDERISSPHPHKKSVIDLS
jgi:hypothetical protein